MPAAIAAWQKAPSIASSATTAGRSARAAATPSASKIGSAHAKHASPRRERDGWQGGPAARQAAVRRRYTFVERDNGEPRCIAASKAVALNDNLLAVEYRHKGGRPSPRQALRHRQHDANRHRRRGRRPRSSTGRPACRVTARSRPPSKHAVGNCSGKRRNGSAGRHKAAQRCTKTRWRNHRPARTDEPPSHRGSTASRQAASAMSLPGAPECGRSWSKQLGCRALHAAGRARLVERIAPQPVAKRRTMRRGADAYRRPWLLGRAPPARARRGSKSARRAARRCQGSCTAWRRVPAPRPGMSTDVRAGASRPRMPRGADSSAVFHFCMKAIRIALEFVAALDHLDA